jgi:hydroxymethylpyrimidine/phosphomethylpyrimidine kinase
VVVDPVMVATSGDLLIEKNAVQALRSRLLPLATIVTPNLPEAEALTERSLSTRASLEDAARRIVDLGARSVLIKGGHAKGAALDLFFDGSDFLALGARRVRTKNTHGTGCTLSAAIAAYLAKGERLDRAAALAKKFITGALQASFTIGAGHSPVNHFYRLWKA